MSELQSALKQTAYLLKRTIALKRIDWLLAKAGKCLALSQAYSDAGASYNIEAAQRLKEYKAVYIQEAEK